MHSLMIFLFLQGASRTKISGGYQVAELIEVGPLVVVGAPSEVHEGDYQDINSSTTLIDCRSARVCQRMNQLKSEYENSVSMMSTGTRNILHASAI